MEETTNDLTPSKKTGRYAIPVLQVPAANSDIETGEGDITGDFIQGTASKETNERAVADSGEPALIQSTSSHKGAVANSGEPVQNVRKTKSRKKSEKRKRSPSPSHLSSSDTDSSDLDTNGTDKRKESPSRFRIIPKTEENKWELPKDMAIYANKFSKEYIPDSDIEETILKEHSIPWNIDRGKEVDNIVLLVLGRTTHVYPWMSFTRGLKRKF